MYIKKKLPGNGNKNVKRKEQRKYSHCKKRTPSSLLSAILGDAFIVNVATTLYRQFSLCSVKKCHTFLQEAGSLLWHPLEANMIWVAQRYNLHRYQLDVLMVVPREAASFSVWSPQVLCLCITIIQ